MLSIAASTTNFCCDTAPTINTIFLRRIWHDKSRDKNTLFCIKELLKGLFIILLLLVITLENGWCLGSFMVEIGIELLPAGKHCLLWSDGIYFFLVTISSILEVENRLLDQGAFCRREIFMVLLLNDMCPVGLL